MLIDSTRYTDEAAIADALKDNVFRYCTLTGFAIDGCHIDSYFLECEFTALDWYGGLFNCAVFIRGNFRDCQFRGATFADCLFVECEFINCRFLNNNMGSPCSAAGTRVYASSATDGEGTEVLLNAVAL
jgi:hypothetical protein